MTYPGYVIGGAYSQPHYCCLQHRGSSDAKDLHSENSVAYVGESEGSLQYDNITICTRCELRVDVECELHTQDEGIRHLQVEDELVKSRRQ